MLLLVACLDSSGVGVKPGPWTGLTIVIQYGTSAVA